MRVHFIAIGGSAMHNLALALKNKGYDVSGSDDEIYEPSKSRLKDKGLLPKQEGWRPEIITSDINAVILGMHAKKDNPELAIARQIGIPIYSYPEYIAKESVRKKRVVIAGSHGKTTTTSIIMNALEYAGKDFDYLVGAQLEGYERMVKLSDADLIILEGDEYLSSPIDRRPKMLHYKPHLAVITGIAWDHINVFPTFKDYVDQFQKFIDTIDKSGKLFYYGKDVELQKLASENDRIEMIPYSHINVNQGKTIDNNVSYPIKLIGKHNYQNIKAAELICLELGLDKDTFYRSLASFKGAAKRLQHIRDTKSDVGNVFLDFAHAPSKVKATVSAVKDQFPQQSLVAILELHTYSSLNKDFLPTYASTLQDADEAVVFFDKHTLMMKDMQDIEPNFIIRSFNSDKLRVISDKNALEQYINKVDLTSSNLLLMSSGKFAGLNLNFIHSA